MFDKLDWRWIFVLILLGGSYGLLSTTNNQSLTRELQARGIKATAFQVNKHQWGTVRAPTYVITFRYKVPDQGIKEARIEVPIETFQRIVDGTNLEVLYLPEDPEKVMIVNTPLSSNQDFYIALGMFLVGLAGTGYLLVNLYLEKKRAQSSP